MGQKKCECGCGEKIVEKPYHKYYGIPKYITGHNTRKYDNIIFDCDMCKMSITRTGSKMIYSNKHFCSTECKHRYFSEVEPIVHKKQWKIGHIPWNIGLKNVNGNCGRPKGCIPWNKGKTNIELFGYKKAEELRKLNREQAIKNFGKYIEDTSIERKIENWLLFNNILYVKQFKYKYGIADFWLPESNTIMEADGNYYHNLPENKKRDYLQTRWLIDNYYNVIRLWESDINNNFNMCVGRIKNAL